MAEKLGIEVPDSRMVTYYTMKRILNEGGFSWRTRNQVIGTRKRWQGGRYEKSTLLKHEMLLNTKRSTSISQILPY